MSTPENTVARLRNLNTAPDLAPTLETARQYIRALTGSTESPMAFFTWPESQEANSLNTPNAQRCGVHTLYGTLAEHAATLAKQNRLGCGVAVTVNRTNLRGRTAADILAVRALFLDFDEPKKMTLAQIETMRPEPHLVVESSAGKHHVYWMLPEGECPLDQFQPAMRKLIRLFGSDKSVCDLPRVMRLPGYFHHKAGPYPVRIVRDRTAA